MYDVISADTHLETPPVLWTERLPKELRERGPRIVELDGGGEGWAVGDGEPVPLGLNATGGQKYQDFVARGRKYADGLAGTGGPEERVAEQKRDGTDAEVLFSTVIGTMLHKMGDPALILASVRAYNDWLSEYCSYDDSRLLGVALVPFTGLDDAVQELRRVRDMRGIRGAHLLRFPSGEHYLTDADEPFWNAADEVGLPIIAHHSFGGENMRAAHPMPGLRDEKALEIEGGADLATFAWLLTCDLPIPTLPIVTLLQLMVSGVLDRHPGLRFHFAETGIGWLPYWLEQMEDRYDRHRFWAKVSLGRRPADYIRDQFTFSFQEDHAGVALRHAIGINNICWASDFPHSVSDWPWSVETRARQFKGVPDNDVRRMQGLNIAHQLGLVTAEDRDQYAQVPLVSFDGDLPNRGERRLA